MKINTKASTPPRNKLLVITLAVIILGLTIAGAWMYATRDNNEPTIDYSPATKDDRTLNDSVKAELDTEPSEQNSPDTTPTSSDKKVKVTPNISAYGQPAGLGTEFKLNGFVPAIIESDGTCTLTLTKDEIVVTVSKGALQNAQNTSCGQLAVPFDKLTIGTWQAVLSYESSAHTGSSVKTEVEIR